MANGDIDVKVRFRSFLPGAGYDVNGLAKQGKTNVRGVITATYLRGGVNLLPADVGLDVIDTLTLTNEEPYTSVNPQQNYRTVGYSKSARQFYCVEEVSAANTDAEVASGTSLSIEFDAFGDAAWAPELL
jgi:hypothetical protein